MEREIEKPEINIEKNNIVEKQEVKQENVLEKEVKAENSEEKKKEILEALSGIKKQEQVPEIISTYNQDTVVSRLVKIAIAEGPEAIRGELEKITDPYIIDQVHDQIMRALNQ
jgi:uncharacterized Fe-S cluster-containing protein